MKYLRNAFIIIHFFIVTQVYTQSDTSFFYYQPVECADISPVCAFLLNDSIAFIGSNSGDVIKLNLNTAQAQRLFYAHPSISRIAGDENLIAVSANGQLQIFHNDGSLMGSYQVENAFIENILIQNQIIFAYGTDFILKFDVKSKTFDKSTFEGLTSVHVNESGLLLGYVDGKLEKRNRNLALVTSSKQDHEDEILMVYQTKPVIITVSKSSIKTWNSDFELLRTYACENISVPYILNNNLLIWYDQVQNLTIGLNLRNDSITIWKDPNQMELSNSGRISSGDSFSYGRLSLLYLKDGSQYNEVSESSFSCMAWDFEGRECLIGATDGNVYSRKFPGVGLQKILSDRLYRQLISIAIAERNEMMFLGTATGICKTVETDQTKVLFEMGLGFVSFNTAHFSSGDQFIYITASSDKSSYVQVVEIKQPEQKNRRNKKVTKSEVRWRRTFADSLPILSSELITHSDLLVVSRGRELLFLNCKDESITYRISVEREVSALHVTSGETDLIVGDVEGYTRRFSLVQNRWLSSYVKICSMPVVSISSTITGDTLFFASEQEIFICDGYLNILNFIKDERVRQLFYSYHLNALAYIVGNYHPGIMYKWRVETNATNDQKSPYYIRQYIGTKHSVFFISNDYKFLKGWDM